MSSDFSRVVGVGGLGGSGTRLVAHLLREMGFHLGHFLNKELDNLVFTRLFKNPDWYASSTEETFGERFDLFCRIMRNEKLDRATLKTYLDTAKENKLHSATMIQRLHFIVKNRFTKSATPQSWAWKEPNTQIMIRRIIPLAEGLRYIHVVRHGLDMAFSKNRQQLINWGGLYGLERPRKKGHDTPVEQLEFWLRSTEDVINNCKPVLDDRFYLLNYNHLIEQPEDEITKLAKFLNVHLTASQLNSLLQHVKKPESDGRYRQHDLSIFSDNQLQRVRKLGFNF
jgi:hypothetical protein